MKKLIIIIILTLSIQQIASAEEETNLEKITDRYSQDSEGIYDNGELTVKFLPNEKIINIMEANLKHIENPNLLIITNKNVYHGCKYSNDYSCPLIKTNGIKSTKHLTQVDSYFQYIKTKKKAYFLNFDETGKELTLDEVHGVEDPSTFKQFNGFFYTDKSNLYTPTIPFSNKFYKRKDVDAKTFSQINSTYYKDKNSIYYFTRKWNTIGEIKGVNPKTFRLIDGFYSEDEDQIFVPNIVLDKPTEMNEQIEKITSKIDIEKKEKTATIFSTKSKSITVDSKDKRINELSFENPDSLKKISNSFLTDGKNIYLIDEEFNIKKVEEADSKTFKQITGTTSFEDKNNIYYEISNSTFEIISKSSTWNIDRDIATINPWNSS